MNLNKLRGEIDLIDKQILELLKKRFDIAVKIGQLKKRQKISITNRSREKEIFEKLKESAKKLDIDNNFAEKLFRLIIAQSKRIQKKT